MNYTVTLNECQRQLLLLSLAHLQVDRPGWKYVTEELARKVDPMLELMVAFVDLRELNLDYEEVIT